MRYSLVNGKYAYVTETEAMYSDMPSEFQEACREAMRAMKNAGTCNADTWKRIVHYYYNVYTAPPAGWFKYWNEPY